MYTAAVLDMNSRLTLRQALSSSRNMEEFGFVFKTSAGESLPHHMTINLGNFNQNLNNPQILGKAALLTVSHFLYNDKICCAVVSHAEVDGVSINTINDQTSGKHITMCLVPPTKPMESNALFKGGALTIKCQSMQLNAIIQEC